LTKLIANEQFKICFIEDEEERRKRADFWLENIQESFYRLSKECGYESVAVTVPLRDSFAPIYNCGPKSIIALRKLMDTTIHKEVLLHSQSEWNFDLLPSEDIFKVYIDCFHSLARERERLNFDTRSENHRINIHMLLDYDVTGAEKRFPWTEYSKGASNFVVHGLPLNLEPCRPEKLSIPHLRKREVAIRVIECFHRGEVSCVRKRYFMIHCILGVILTKSISMI
jgi:hypothetical protein